MSESEDKGEPQRRGPSGFIKRFMKRITGGGGANGSSITDAIRETVDEDATMERSRKDMILKAAGFDTLRVEDVMRPRADIVAIEVQATLGEAARMFSESQHSRLPIYRDTLDDPVGFVHVRDVMTLLAPVEDEDFGAEVGDRVLARVKRDMLYVPQSMKLSSLLLRMQSSRIHLAFVVDEYGGTDGLITMEDIVEQIVGEIDDEHDEDGGLIEERSSQVFEADGRAEIGALEAVMKVSLSLPDHEGEYDTVGGLAVALAGRVPQLNEILRHPAGFEIDILDANPRRVKRVRLRIGAAAMPPTAAAARVEGASAEGSGLSSKGEPSSSSPAAA
jgi:CBS domain containing-hemolysin-like protein